MYTVASPDPNPRGGGELPNPNECNSTLTTNERVEPRIFTPTPMDVNDRGHRLRIILAPRRQTPGHDLKGAKTLLLGQSLCTKILTKTESQKPHPET